MSPITGGVGASIRVTLRHGIAHKGRTLNSVTMRRPLLADMVIAERWMAAESYVDLESALLARCTNLPPKAVTRLVASDFRAIMNEAEHAGFFDPPPTKTPAGEEAHRRNDPTTATTVALQHPVAHNGRAVTTVTLRQPLVQDLVIAERRATPDSRRDSKRPAGEGSSPTWRLYAAILAQCSDLPPETVAQLTVSDCRATMERANASGFFDTSAKNVSSVSPAKRASMKTPTPTIAVALRHAVDHDGQPLTTVTVRRPLVGDLLNVERRTPANSAVAQHAGLLAQCSDLPPEVVRKLTASDFNSILARAQTENFFDAPPDETLSTEKATNASETPGSAPATTATITVTLQHAVAPDGHAPNTVTMRRPLVSDMIIAERRAAPELEVAMDAAILAQCSDLPPDAVTQLTASDFRSITTRAKAAGFFDSPSAKTLPEDQVTDATSSSRTGRRAGGRRSRNTVSDDGRDLNETANTNSWFQETLDDLLDFGRFGLVGLTILFGTIWILGLLARQSFGDTVILFFLIWFFVRGLRGRLFDLNSAVDRVLLVILFWLVFG